MHKIRLLLLTVLILAIPAALYAQFSISVAFAPPALPVYEQPVAPADGYLWTPGYWAYADQGYFWVPGTWVLAPEPGLLWTPGYWGWRGDAYAWNGGYWGPHVGFYGGVNYGYGYGGQGYQGGYWNNGAFNYNRSVNNVNVTNIHNTYNTTVINNANNVSYNGGTGGIAARPTATDETAARESHRQPTALQTEHVHAASTNHELLASVNQGRPPIAATAKPGEFQGQGVVAAKEAGAPYKAPENKAAENKAAENKAAENKAAENKAAENKATENKAAENQAVKPNVPRAPAEAAKAIARTESTPPPQAAPRPEPRPEVRPEPASRPAPIAQERPTPRPETAPKTEARPETAAREQAPPAKESHEEEKPRQ